MPNRMQTIRISVMHTTIKAIINLLYTVHLKNAYIIIIQN